jgi:dolichol-phosphate mannosyltransferase
MTASVRRPSLDIVVPLYNEEQVVALFHGRLMDVVTSLRRERDIRIYYVNDGSTDGTGAELEKLAARDAGVTIVELSRNFGHQAALTAGLDLASADAVVTLDGDGQHPPEPSTRPGTTSCSPSAPRPTCRASSGGPRPRSTGS